MGIEPTSSAWKAEVLPLNYTRFRLGKLGITVGASIRHRCALLARPPLRGLA